MFSSEQKKELDQRVNDSKINYAYAQIAQISISEIMTAIKVAPSYKELVPSQTDPTLMVTNYINERDYYGKRPYLNKNAILLYIYLHFVNPTATGQVYLSVSEAAKFMDLSKKTIRDNLRILLKHDYIRYIAGDVPGVYIVYIDNYMDKGKKAKSGYKGYFNMSLSTFVNLLQRKKSGINELRIQMRGLLQCVPGLNKDRFSEISIKGIKQLLPSYVHLKDVKRLLVTDSVRNLFNVKFGSPDSCIIKIKTEYNPMSIKDELVSDCDRKVRKMVKKWLSQKKNSTTLLRFSEKDYIDISKIALRLPVEDILNGVKSMFDNYSAVNVASIGGLVRVLSHESYTNRLISSQ